MQVIGDKIYGSELVPNEVNYELHQRATLKLGGWDYLRLLVGKKLMISLCLELVVVKDSEGKFLDLDTNKITSKVLVVDESEEADTVEAKFSHDYYKDLHES